MYIDVGKEATACAHSANTIRYDTKWRPCHVPWLQSVAGADRNRAVCSTSDRSSPSVATRSLDVAPRSTIDIFDSATTFVFIMT